MPGGKPGHSLAGIAAAPPCRRHQVRRDAKPPQKEIDHRRLLETRIERKVTQIDYPGKCSSGIEAPFGGGAIPRQRSNLGEVGDFVERLDHNRKTGQSEQYRL